jgi:glycolate oxidase
VSTEGGAVAARVDAAFVAAATAVVGADFVRVDDASRLRYGTDALKLGQPADLVVIPGTTAEVAAIARLCGQAGVPLVPRGAGTGYTGGAVPVRGGVVVSLERFTRILSIDPRNLLVVVQPGVITGTLQDAVEDIGLFYPPDPASRGSCFIGGNVSENSGGPKAVKYGGVPPMEAWEMVTLNPARPNAAAQPSRRWSLVVLCCAACEKY